MATKTEKQDKKKKEKRPLPVEEATKFIDYNFLLRLNLLMTEEPNVID